jgi:hypothetical protein
VIIGAKGNRKMQQVAEHLIRGVKSTYFDMTILLHENKSHFRYFCRGFQACFSNYFHTPNNQLQ